MLQMTFSKPQGKILELSPGVYFDAKINGNLWWLEDDFAKAAVKDIDNSIVRSPRCIESPVLGQIAPSYLSGGVKTVIVIRNVEDENIVFRGSCGDNCAKWLLKACIDRDRLVYYHHYMHFDGFDWGDGKINMVDIGRVVSNADEYQKALAEVILNGKGPK